MAESILYETFDISPRDSSHKYTPQGVKLLSCANTESLKPAAAYSEGREASESAAADHSMRMSVDLPVPGREL